MRFVTGSLLSRPTRRRSLTPFALAALVIVVSFFVAPLRALAAPNTVVTPNNPDGWQPANVRANATVGITSAQPRGDAPNNLGSLEFTTNTLVNGQDKADYVKYWGALPGRTLGNISALSYELYRASSSTTGQHFVPAFRLVYQTSGGQTGYLIWENVYNGGSTSAPVPTDQWLSKNILNGYFWMRAFGPGRTIEKYDVTLAQWASGYTYADSQPLDANTSIIGIELGVGSGWGGTFRGFVDNVAASFGGDSVSANFEPNPVVAQCTTDCYVDDDTGNDANGGTSFADAKQHIQAGITQVSSGGTVHVKDGTYNENLVISKPLTLEGAQHGVLAKGRSGAQSVVQALNSSVPVNIQADDVTIDGFVFDGSAATSQPWIITALSEPGNGRYEDVHILNNEFKGNPGNGTFPGGMYLSNHDDLVIQGNFFNALGQHAVFLAGTSTNAVYRNNDSYRNYNSNISTQDQGAGHQNILIENNRAVEDDMILFNMHNAVVRNNTITGGAFSTSRVWLGGGNTNVTISGNSFASLQSTAVQVFDPGFGYGPNSSISVTGNTINTTVANQVDNYSLIDLRDVNGSSLIDSNKVTLSGAYAAGGSATYAVGVRGSGTGTVTITNNAFDGGNVASTGTPPSSGILIRSNSANGALSAITTINITNNYLKNFSNGLAVYDFVANSYGGLGTGVGLTVNRNSITGNSANGVITSANDPTLNAERNWWGSNTGPTAASNPSGTGDKATGNVDFDPWLCSGTDDAPGTTGFQTSSTASPCGPPPPPQCTTTCYADAVNGSDTNGGASAADAKKTIQAAVNQVSPNGTVIVAAGTYNENVSISKDGLTIQGAGTGQTIVQSTSCTGNGITLVGSRNGLTVKKLSVTGFENGIYLGVISDTQTNITIEDVNASSNCRHGIISQDGVITNLAVNRVTASNNGLPNSNQTGSPGRGIWIINGIKTNISVTNSTVSSNFLTGIDLGDGNVTGLTITGNTVEGNGDAGISVLGAKGPSANLIDSNIVRNNGRFGIEVKASTGTGNDSGAGSLVISRNIVERNVTATDARDYAGIAVVRRSGQAQFNDDQPSGAVVKENEVRGYRRAATSTGDGFGIVVEGLNNTVKNNIVTNNDVGIQVQGGNTANVQNTPGFDRGDAVQGSANVNYNSIAGNGIGLRTVGTITPTPLNAENNWWGSNTGPQPTGSGDSVVSSTPNGVDYDPWLCSGQDTSSATGFQPNPQTSPCAPPAGTLQITKYNDQNRNGARDTGEPGLSGWAITVKQGSTTVASGTTDGTGTVTFANLAVGSYTVCETLQASWVNTDPSNGSGCKTATVTANSTTTVLLGNAARATKLIFSTQPGNGTTTTPLNPQPVVKAVDANGNVDTSFNGPVTLTIGANPGGGTLSGTTTVNAVNGVATFSGLTINKPGIAYTLVASSPGLTSATSQPFNIRAVATKLIFSTQPGNGTTTTPLSPQPVVKAVDANGNVDTSFNGPVTLTIGANPGGGTLSGTTTVNAVNGVATFSGLTINKIGFGYTLVASASGLTSATSAPFNVLDGGQTCSSILDNFNRKDGGLGSNWIGPEGLGGYSIRSNQVQVFGGGPIYWTTSFGSDQYVCKKLTKVDASGEEQSLVLKVQGSTPNWRNGAIDVNYLAASHTVRVDTFQPGNAGPFDSWRHFTSISVTFNDGDVFAARALADGTVRVYKNGALVGSVDTKGASLAKNNTLTYSGNGNFFVNKGGRVGIWDINVPNAKFDDFGGGTIAP